MEVKLDKSGYFKMLSITANYFTGPDSPKWRTSMEFFWRHLTPSVPQIDLIIEELDNAILELKNIRADELKLQGFQPIQITTKEKD